LVPTVTDILSRRPSGGKHEAFPIGPDLSIRRGTLRAKRVEVEVDRFGRKYTVVGMLTGPVGVVEVVTVWLEETGRAGVRLVTVQPR
jgi:hypothetical protein